MLRIFSRRSAVHISPLVLAAVILLVQAACLTTPAAAPAAPTQDETKIALGVAATGFANQQTEAAKAAQDLQSKQATDLQLTAAAISLQQTQIANAQSLPPAQTSAPVQPVEPPAPAATTDPMAGMDQKIRNAKVLIFEDTSELGIGQWIEETVNRIGISNYVQTDDYSGTFMKQLNSATQWDLILIGAEEKTKIQGEFWDAVMIHVNRKAAVIAEIWNMNFFGNGRMKLFTEECGVSYARNYDLAESIYWWDQFHPLFSTPNIVEPLINYNRFWANETGDKMRVIGGDAKLIAGDQLKPHSDGGVIAVCMGGRTIIQTFSNHDYHENQIKDLWENYIIYTLTNHFLAIQ